MLFEQAERSKSGNVSNSSRDRRLGSRFKSLLGIAILIIQNWEKLKTLIMTQPHHSQCAVLLFNNNGYGTIYMPQAGFDPLKQSATRVLKLSRRSTSKPPQLDFNIALFLNQFYLKFEIDINLTKNLTTLHY